jgi:flagellar motility protein MotE (MotC chaperone)
MKVITLWSDAAVAIAANGEIAASKPAAKPATKPPEAKTAAKEAAPAESAKPPAAETAGGDAAGQPAAKQFDPELASESELELLQRLAKRRTELDDRARDLDLREGMLKATEQRIDQKIGELKKIQETVEATIRKSDAEHDEKIQSLVKIYETMKPKDAARIFEQLDMPILLDVVERMREAKTAPILASMEPAKAKTVTAALAERRALPGGPARAAAR